MVKATPEELANGWTDETLTAYLKEHEKDGQSLIDMTSEQRQIRPEEQNHRYNPLRWRD